MKTLRLQLRFLIPLLLTLVATAYFALPLMDQLTLRWFARDLNTRGELVANTLAEPLGDALAADNKRRVQSLIDRAAQDERMVAIALCTPDGSMLNRTAASCGERLTSRTAYVCCRSIFTNPKPLSSAG